MIHKNLMGEIEAAVPEGGAWCTVEKALTLASIVVALRPQVIVELGVWRGGSAIPMAIALRHIGAGQLVAVDAWSAEASASGQEGEHQEWWGKTVGTEGHEEAFRAFMARLEKHTITSELCSVMRKSTDEADVPPAIDILHHDANHGPQAVKDIDRWAPAIRVGGMLILDDVNWPGGSVQLAKEHAIAMGFVELYEVHVKPSGPWSVMQRVRG